MLQKINEWLLDNTDSLVAAANFTAVFFLGILTVVTIGVIKRSHFKPESGMTIILYGVALEAFAWAVHRSWWGIWRLVREYGHEGLGKWFIDHAYISLVPSFLVLVGLGLILTPFWNWLRSGTIHGRVDWFIPAGFMFGVYFLIWTLI